MSVSQVPSFTSVYCLTRIIIIQLWCLTVSWISIAVNVEIPQVLIVWIHHVLIFLFTSFLSYSVYLSWVLFFSSLIWCFWRGKMTALPPDQPDLRWKKRITQLAFDVVVLSGLRIIVFHFRNWWFGKVQQIERHQVYTREPCFCKKCLYWGRGVSICHFPPSQQCSWLRFAVMIFLWCLLWVQSLPLSLLSSFLLCVLCVLRVSWLWWTTLATVGLTARGAPLWPLCVSAEQGSGGGRGERCGGVGGLGLDGLDCGDDGNECFGFFSFFCKLRCCRCLRNQWEWFSCFATIHRTDMPHQLLCLENPVFYVFFFFLIFAKKKKKINDDVFKWTWFEMNMRNHPTVEPLNDECTQQITRDH